MIEHRLRIVFENYDNLRFLVDRNVMKGEEPSWHFVIVRSWHGHFDLVHTVTAWVIGHCMVIESLTN